MLNDPLVSVLLPVYNGEKYISESIESILKQTFTNFELLVINDGSTDRTEEIILSIPDQRIRYVKNEKNIKLISTLNRGINLAKGKYIARMDADDISLPNRLDSQVKFLEKNDNVGLLGTWFEYFNDENYALGKLVKYAESDQQIRLKHLYQIHICHGTSMFRKDLVFKYDLFYNTEFSHAEDYELWTRFQRVTKTANLGSIHYKVRDNDNSVSKVFVDKQKSNTINVIKSNWKSIGVKLGKDKIEVLLNVFYANFQLSILQLYQAEELLTSLIKANQKSDYLNNDFLLKFATSKWFDLCYNNPELGKTILQIYNKSSLRSNNIILRSKLWIKSIL